MKNDVNSNHLKKADHKWCKTNLDLIVTCGDKKEEMQKKIKKKVDEMLLEDKKKTSEWEVSIRFYKYGSIQCDGYCDTMYYNSPFFESIQQCPSKKRRDILCVGCARAQSSTFIKAEKDGKVKSATIDDNVYTMNMDLIYNYYWSVDTYNCGSCDRYIYNQESVYKVKTPSGGSSSLCKLCFERLTAKHYLKMNGTQLVRDHSYH